MLDSYCERTAPGLWDEPLNTVTNLAFLIAAGVAMAVHRRHAGTIPDRGVDLWLLRLWLIAIGIGSGLWHLTARRWAWWLDVVPIQLFILSFFLSFMQRVLGWGLARMGLALGGFIVLSVVVEATVGNALNGSASYFPAYALLLTMTGWLYRQGSPVAWLFGLASGVFLVSVSFRSMDMAVCDAWSPGTHFLWHVLNAVVLGSLLVAMIRVAAGQPSAPAPDHGSLN